MLLYIDATAGGLLLQALLGGSAGVAVVIRLFWGRLPWRRERHPDTKEEPAKADAASKPFER